VIFFKSPSKKHPANVDGTIAEGYPTEGASDIYDKNATNHLAHSENEKFIAS
jgi:hypothetical protein